MKKFFVLLLVLLIPNIGYCQFTMFGEYLLPASDNLRKEIKKVRIIDSNFENRLKDLRDIAYATGAKNDSKLDLAAFLLRKVEIQRKQPFEINEPIILEAADLIPGNFYLEKNWADLLFFKGDYEQALSHYENALYKNPNHIEVTGMAALSAQQLMQYEKALEYYEKVYQKKPKNFFLCYSMGKCHFELKDLEEAINFWEQALKLANNEKQKKAIKQAIGQAKELLASTEGSTTDESQRFVIHYGGNSQEDLGDVATDLLDEVYDQVTNDLQVFPDVQINILFFLTEEYYKINKSWSAGAAQGIKVMIPLKSGYKSEDYLRGLLAHEFTHTMIHLKTNNRCPLWLNEGLAQYEEFKAAYGSAETLRSDYEGIFQNEFLDKQNFIKLRNVPAYIGGKNRKGIAIGYIASYMAVRFLADRYTETSFEEILTLLGKGKYLDEALEEVTGNDLAGFQNDYENWLRNY